MARLIRDAASALLLTMPQMLRLEVVAMYAAMPSEQQMKVQSVTVAQQKLFLWDQCLVLCFPFHTGARDLFFVRLLSSGFLLVGTLGSAYLSNCSVESCLT